MPRMVCETCTVKKCGGYCEALKLIDKYYREERQQARGIELLNLSEELSVWDSFPDEEMKELGNKIIDKFEHLQFIRDLDIQIGYVKCTEPKQEKGERVLGECVKVKTYLKAWLPYDFIIVFYDLNIDYLDENQIKILMLHELQHIGIGLKGFKINEHNVKDFSNIITAHTLNWADYDQENIDILGGE